MNGMTVGGVDPSILRELSGVYKPFVKAFKELVSNAYDADADEVRVEFTEDFSNAVIADDGAGMSPFEFRNDFARIGGSSRKWTRGKTNKGRERIGNKGIGFLALARYCNQMIVESSRSHRFTQVYRIEKTPASIDLRTVLGVPMRPKLLESIFSCKVRRVGRKTSVALSKYRLDWRRARLSITEDVGPADVSFSIECGKLAFKATLDFDRLLKLADSADLEKLSDFALIEVRERAKKEARGTRISINGLKPFVVQELRRGRRKGFVRNVASRSGLEQLIWNLARCAPVAYADALSVNEMILPFLRDSLPTMLDSLTVSHGGKSEALNRPLYALEDESSTMHADMVVPVSIEEGGLVATGFLSGYESVVFPAEYRGVSIRVRGVAIGEPTFLGAEYLLTGSHKAALSQITGEINVIRGFDAVDALNPGRESFYEESPDYLTFRRHFLGEDEKVSGLLSRTIDSVLRRSQARSSLNNVMGRASYIRRAIDDVSAGITYLLTQGGKSALSIKDMLSSRDSHANGLASAKDAFFGVPQKVAGMPVRPIDGGSSEAAIIDHESKEVLIDVSRPEWDGSIILFNRRFDVLHKHGNAGHSIAEIDFRGDRIYVNWGHPAKSQMDERGFLRTALAWVLARTAAPSDPDQMMEMAITLLSYTTQSDA